MKLNHSNTNKSEVLDRLLSAAQTEFAKHGYAAASLSEIARKAGVSKQLLHHYFRDRNKLYNTLVTSVTRSVLHLYDDPAYELLPPTEAIEKLVLDIINLHKVVPTLATLTLDQGLHKASHIDSQSSIAEPTRDFIQNIITGILNKGAEEGIFRSDVDPSLFYTTIFHLAAGCFLIGASTKNITGFDLSSDKGVEAWQNNALDFVLSYLKNSS